MLFTLDGKQINRVPDNATFNEIIQLLGEHRAEGVRHAVNQILDDMPPDTKNGRRTFSTAQVGEALKPWPYPLASLYDVALDIEGKDTTGRQVHDRSLRIFELFVRECIMAREERWVIDDQNVGPSDPNRPIAETVYVEQGPDETSTRQP